MSAACDNAAQGVGNGIAAALQAVDCVANESIAGAFGRLFAPGGALVTVLTILLTLFVAWFGINLLLGRANLSVRSLTPRMMTIGVVLTIVTSWVAYSTLVWNLAIGGPDEIATVITGSQGSATQVFAQKIDVVFQALQQAAPQTDGKDVGAFSPEGMMWLGAMLLLLGTVGVLVTARIALAVLVAVGPIFVVMALFESTRGMFTGWLKGLVMLALVPLFAVLGGSIMLELAVPVLASLVATPGQVDPQAAMAFFVIGAVHAALMIMVLKVAGTMVSGWRVFGMVPDRMDKADRPATVISSVAPAAGAVGATGAAAAGAGTGSGAGPTDRRIPVAAFATAPAANDAGGGARDVRVINNTLASGSGQAAPAMPGAGRARGIGSRFKSAPPRLSEKTK